MCILNYENSAGEAAYAGSRLLTGTVLSVYISLNNKQVIIKENKATRSRVGRDRRIKSPTYLLYNEWLRIIFRNQILRVKLVYVNLSKNNFYRHWLRKYLTEVISIDFRDLSQWMVFEFQTLRR